MPKYLILILCISFFPLSAIGQVYLYGIVVDSIGQSVADANLGLRMRNSTVYFAHTKSEIDGSFKIEIKNRSIDSIFLEISHLSYTKKTISLLDWVNQNGSTDFKIKIILTPRTQLLEEIKLQPMPIFRQNDTLNYHVNSFKSQGDRVIADVLRKLPGIAIINGKIEYQGEAIQKFTVNNLDLMGGQYALINNNLPANAVQKIQIIENDQPIKIMDSIVFSDKTSLNLVVKNYSTTSTGHLGSGVTSGLWDMGITPITIAKKFQMLNTFQSNNIGHDVIQDQENQYSAGASPVISIVDFDATPIFSSVSQANKPSFEQRKWLKNQVFMGSNQMLWEFPNAWQFRTQATYFQDKQKHSGFTLFNYNTPEKTDQWTEKSAYQNYIHTLHTGITIDKNVKSIYFRNNLQFRRRWNREQSDVVFKEEDNISQTLQNQELGLMNMLSASFFIGKQLITFTSGTSWQQSPQHFSVVPGQMTDLLNGGSDYDELTQEVLYRNFNTQNTWSWTRAFGYWRFNPGIHVDYQNHALTSKMGIRKGSQLHFLEGDYKNDFQQGLFKLGVDANLAYERARLKWSINLPVKKNIFNLAASEKEQNYDNTLTFNPRLNVNFLMNRLHTFSGYAGFGKQLENLNQRYPAYILRNFRTIERLHSKLLSNQSMRSGLGYRFMNPRNALGIYFDYNLSVGVRDYIYNHKIDSNGQTSLELFDKNSHSTTHNLSGRVSKAFFNIKTSTRIGFAISTTKSEYLIHDHLVKNNTNSYSANWELSNDLLNFMVFNYNGKVQLYDIQFSSRSNQKILDIRNFLNIQFFINSQHRFLLDNALYTTNVTEADRTYFLDMTYRYHIKKWKTDLDFSFQNVLNQKEHVQQRVSDYLLTQSFFELRPRQIVVSTRFSF